MVRMESTAKASEPTDEGIAMEIWTCVVEAHISCLKAPRIAAVGIIDVACIILYMESSVHVD